MGNVTYSEYDNLGRLTHVIRPTPAAAATATIDDEGTGYSTTGTWTESTSGGSSGDHYYHAASGGGDTAKWEFGSLNAAKRYQIFATWQADANNAPDAPYSIRGYNGTSETTLATAQVNQTLQPTDDVNGATTGHLWQRLGFFTGYETLRVYLGTSAAGEVVADAIRIVEVGPVDETQYNDAGQVVQTIDPMGAVTAFEYDAIGRQTKVTLHDLDGGGGTYTSPIHQT